MTPFHAISSLDELRLALHRVGCPAVLKTAGWGYDGKGQIKIESADHADIAWGGLESNEAILEAFVDFEKEVSIIAARGMDGSFVELFSFNFTTLDPRDLRLHECGAALEILGAACRPKLELLAMSAQRTEFFRALFQGQSIPACSVAKSRIEVEVNSLQRTYRFA